MAGHYRVVTLNSSIPGKCSPWSQDRLQFIVFALVFSPSYIMVVTQSITCTINIMILHTINMKNVYVYFVYIITNKMQGIRTTNESDVSRRFHDS